MPVTNIDFDDLPEDALTRKETITVSFKLDVSTQEMFKKIAARERRNMSEMGGIVIEDYINNYVKQYQSKKD